MKDGPRAVFLDIDGTLLWDSAKPPCAQDIAALREARRRGHYVFINTGRAQGFLPEVLRDADYLDGFLMGCGTHLVMGGKTVFADVIAHDVLDEVLAAFFAAAGNSCIFEAEECNYMFGRASEPYPLLTSPDDFRVRFPHARVSKLTVFGQATAWERSVLSPYFDLLEHNGYYEAVLHGHGKGRGLRRVCAMLDVPLENSIAVGDSINDLDMIRCAGVGVAMANACDKLLLACDQVTAPCGRGGVAEAVRRLMLDA